MATGVAQLTARQRSALQYVARCPCCRLKELAFELGVALSTAAGHVERLRLNGLVVKPGGTRKFVLTRAGAEALTGERLVPN